MPKWQTRYVSGRRVRDITLADGAIIHLTTVGSMMIIRVLFPTRMFMTAWERVIERWLYREAFMQARTALAKQRAAVFAGVD
jgi:hypothetical protein